MSLAQENAAPAEGNPPPPAGPNAAAAPLPAAPEALPTVGGDVDVDIDRPAAESTANGTRASAPASGAGDAKDPDAITGDKGGDCPPSADGDGAADAPGDDATGEEPDDGEEEEQGASESSDGGEEKEEVWVSAEV